MRLQSIAPIGDFDHLRIHVRDLASTMRWCETKLGFRLVSYNDADRTALLSRDDATIGFVQDENNTQGHFCYIEVSDVDEARTELVQTSASPNEVKPMEFDGRLYRVFYVKDEDNDNCYCIGTQQTGG